MLVTAEIISIPAGLALWLCAHCRSVGHGCRRGHDGLSIQKHQNSPDPEKKFVFLLTTMIACLSLLVFLQSL